VRAPWPLPSSRARGVLLFVLAISDFFLVVTKGKCWEWATKGFVITGNIINCLFVVIILLSDCNI
jgi:hypothetical protein